MVSLSRFFLFGAVAAAAAVDADVAHTDMGAAGVDADAPLLVVPGINMSSLSLEGLDNELQKCPILLDLNTHLHTISPPSPLTTLFSTLFPSTHPGINALLATLYISGPPNLLLALCPTNIDPSSLQLMVSFAFGGLMGDTLFHLLPEIFLGEPESEDGKVRVVLVEPNRNLLLGFAILVGFMTFVAVDKAMRIATGGGGHDHGHGHSHGGRGEVKGTSSGADLDGKADGVRLRKKGENEVEDGKKTEKEKGVNQSIKLGGYLNLVADFTHNITDGLAMSASFYASPALGATTTVAVFFHEIPHEVGDFALLVQSGFTKWQAMGAQFVTAVGALLGTLIGIAIQEFGGSSSADSSSLGSDGGMPMNAGLARTSLRYGDLLLPFTAGTFLYVATVAVMPEMLETDGRPGEVRRTITQFAAVGAGAGIMLWISWH